ncbi:MAG: hypothetical protein A2018_04680 [Alphaproteobacteria bacterium GWF2_58_20]|nr:MAG: hypothetical protein A2018_04680 [Alphaproteobacteria bacterium GWF2_58_20]
MKVFFITILLVLLSARSKLRAADHETFGQAIFMAGEHSLSVDLATTPTQQERGLMFRNSLPEGSGMLFLFSPPRKVGMWMKNTLIPLDMVFIDTNKSIAAIAENTIPESLRIISSRKDSMAVLELPAGDARRLGLVTGMPVSWIIPLPENKN